MATQIPFSAYRGDSNYVFVCYAHDDAELVYSELQQLNNDGCNIWYDEGIPIGSEWNASIAKAIDNAEHFLFFVSGSSVNSRNCRDEVHYALKQGRDIVVVYLEETKLPGGLDLSLGLSQAIFRHEMPADRYLATLIQALGRANSEEVVTTATLSRPSLKTQNYAISSSIPTCLAVAKSTVWRIQGVDAAYNIGELFGLDHPASVSTERGSRKMKGGQAAIFNSIGERVKHNSGSPSRLVVTGIAGAGKSVMLRRLSVKFAEQFQNDTKQILPVYIPLGRIGFHGDGAEAESESGVTWQAILERWCEWAEKIYAQYLNASDQHRSTGVQFSLNWIEQWLDENPCMLVLDGVDEFLSRNPQADLGRFIKALTELQERFIHNGALTVVLGVRNNQTGLKSLVSNPNDFFEVDVFSVEEAKAFAPGVIDVFNRLESPTARQAILTPLILAHLRPAISSGGLGLDSHAAILRSALEGILHWNDISETDDYIDALAVIAWCFFKNFRSEMSRSNLQAELEKDQQIWAEHLEQLNENPSLDLRFQTYQSLLDPEFLEKVLHKTVLINNGRENYTFIHREWEDFSTAAYFADSLRKGYVDFMGHRAFFVGHFNIASQLLQDDEFDARLVEQVINRTVALKERFIVGNFVALTGFCRNRITAPAIRLLLTSLDAMDPLALHVGFTLMGTRALFGESRDSSAVMLRTILHKEMLRLLDPDISGVARATSSMCWCFLRAYSNRYGMKMPDIPRPVLDDTAAAEALAWVCDPSKPLEEPSAQYRSLQLAYLEEQKHLEGRTDYLITNLHYLFFLSVAWANQVHIPEVAEILPSMFGENPEINGYIKSYSLVPETKHIYEECRQAGGFV